GDVAWAPFLRDRTETPLEALPREVLARCGYKISYTKSPPNPAARIARRGAGGVSARDSLGLSFDGEGKITGVIPGMIGDKAGLAPGMKVIGVNGRGFSSQRLLDAVSDSVTRQKFEFLLIEGDHFRTVALDYPAGPKSLVLVRDSSKPDLLAEILKPIAAKTPTPRQAGTGASPPAPKGYVCYRASRPIQIDGKLDDKDWESAPWTDAFVDIEGD